MGKHSSGKITSNDKSKVKLMIMALIIIVCIIAFVIFKIYLEKKPEDSINSFFVAIKESDVDLANKYADYKQLIDSLDEMILKNVENSSEINVEKELFRNIEWNIENVEFEDNKAIAVVEVKNKNFKNIITKWMKELLNYKSSGDTITNDFALKKLKEVIIKENETKTVIKKVILNRKDGDWIIEINEDLRDLVYPGVDSVISVLESN